MKFANGSGDGERLLSRPAQSMGSYTDESLGGSSGSSSVVACGDDGLDNLARLACGGLSMTRKVRG